jgi:Putative Actinobacterial Holin-X, holin superfamily III
MDRSRDAQPGSAEDRSLAELLQALSEQSSRLASQEIELAKAEMSAKGKQVAFGVGAFSISGLLALLALGALTAAAILALATAMDGWLAALIVAVVYLLLAGIAALAGKAKVEAGAPPLPEQAIESVKDDLDATKERVKEARA